jgi:hypothetical protein
MQLHRKKTVLSNKRVGQNCETTEDLEERNYQIWVRFHLCSTSMWADDDIERDITSSDVDFLEGGDGKISKSKLQNDEGSGEKKLPDLGEFHFKLCLTTRSM